MGQYPPNRYIVIFVVKLAKPGENLTDAMPCAYTYAFTRDRPGITWF